MITRTCWATVFTFLVAAWGAPLSAAAAPPQPDKDALKQAVADLRTVGTAMYAWYQDEMEPRRTGAKPEVDADLESVNFEGVPAISREELERLLVPRYLQAIPERDPWGRPYEFRLETRDPDTRQAMGLRSAGSDGEVSGRTYAVGPFVPEEDGHDLVWMDGFFATWPQKK